MRSEFLDSHPSSYRDPAGYVYLQDGVFKRAVTRKGRQDYDLFISSGLYDDLLNNSLILPHREEHDGVHASPEIYKTLVPEQLAFVSYPYEWCFSQYRDAALLTLEIQETALRHGMSLKDATPFNVQFKGPFPVHIDTLSFERDTGQPWVAYNQFCRQFLAPLLLMGWQIAATYEFQPGPLLAWGNLFYYGDLSAFEKDASSTLRTLEQWFNTSLPFERNASRTAAAFHVRVFPRYFNGLRADGLKQWNGNLLREFRITERVRFQVRADAMNLQNRSQMATPELSPTSTNFGRITSQTSSLNRFYQIQGRIHF